VEKKSILEKSTNYRCQPFSFWEAVSELCNNHENSSDINIKKLVHSVKDICNFLNADLENHINKVYFRELFQSQLSSVTANTIFIYNTGTCLYGNSLSNMAESLLVNTIIPLMLALSIISTKQSNDQNYTRMRTTILFISSGDGERAMINSQIIRELDTLLTIPALIEYIHQLLVSFDESFEYAFGPTPMYSLSKLLLNKATILLNDELCKQNLLDHMRVVACCPGNFVSPMSTEEELQDSEHVLDVMTAANFIYNIALDFETFPSGNFYRFGKRISW